MFVIKEENLEEFRTTVGKRFENKVKVEYAFQRLDDLPEGYTVPEGRVKPWGTAHALLAARNCVNEPFAVILSPKKQITSRSLNTAFTSSYCLKFWCYIYFLSAFSRKIP